MSRWWKRLELGCYHANASVQKYNDREWEECLRSGLLRPQHLPLFFEECLWSDQLDAEEQLRRILSNVEKSRKVQWTERGLEFDGEKQEKKEEKKSREKNRNQHDRERPLEDPEVIKEKKETSDDIDFSFFDNLYSLEALQDGCGTSSSAPSQEDLDDDLATSESQRDDDQVELTSNTSLDTASCNLSPPSVPPANSTSPLDDEAHDWPRHLRSVLSECSIVVGMHPDQAAEAIVDFALARGIPFALTPCCTYAEEFPKRKLCDGTPVRTYESLVQYLVEKDPEQIAVLTLPFEGKNQVVYSKTWKSRTSWSDTQPPSPSEPSLTDCV